MVTGVRMVLQPGRGRMAVPVRSAIFGATLSVAALTASLVFAASLGHPAIPVHLARVLGSLDHTNIALVTKDNAAQVANLATGGTR